MIRDKISLIYQWLPYLLSRDFRPKKDIKPSPPKSSKANALLILSKRSSLLGNGACCGTAGGVGISTLLLPLWAQAPRTPDKPLKRAPIGKPTPVEATDKVSTLDEGAFLRPKKLGLSLSNFEGDGGDSPGLNTGRDSKLVERCRLPSSVFGKLAERLDL